jgi:hypothetical protein
LPPALASFSPAVAGKATSEAPLEKSRRITLPTVWLFPPLAPRARSRSVHIALEASGWQIPPPDGILPTRIEGLFAFSRSALHFAGGGKLVGTVRHNSTGLARLSLIAAGVLGVLAYACPLAAATSTAARVSSPPASPVSAQFAVADFDGDQRPDFAAVEMGQEDSQNALYWIAFRLSSGRRRCLGIAAPAGGVEIAPVDVNADGYLDVVVTTHWTRRPVAILLNDGRGNFRLTSPAFFPQALRLSNFQLDMRSLQSELYSPPLFFSGHEWNLSGFVTQRSSQSVVRHCSLWVNGAARISLFHHLPSRAPPSISSQA